MVSGMRRAPATLLAASALGVALGLDALRGVFEMQRLGAGMDVLGLARGVALVACGLATLVTLRRGVALVQVGLALWVYLDLAPVVGELAAGRFAQLGLWLRPLPVAAFLFFPLAFLGWRSAVRLAR
jgi:hypothetical protein